MKKFIKYLKNLYTRNKKVEVLFGDMIFSDNAAIILSLDKRAMCKIKDLDNFCEDGLEFYECYLVPSEFKGKIVYPTT